MKIPLLALSLLATASHATVVTLSPSDIHGDDTNTVSFTNADVTLTPLVGGLATTFNGLAARLGTDPAGTNNNNAFGDPDIIVGNANDESLVFDFQPTVGLTQISWDFARADGPLSTDGVRISGFLSDPGATLSGAVTNSSVSYSGGVLNIQVAGADFGNPDGFLNLASGAASAGQTLTLTVNDSTQAGAQLPILSISYDNAVPEPSVALLGGLGLLGLLRRRR